MGPTLPLHTVLTTDEAMEDFRFVMERVRRIHPLFLEELPEDFSRLLQTETDRLAHLETPQVLDVWQSVSRVLATLRDGHTRADAYLEEVLALPHDFTWRENRLYANDREVLAIGGLTVDTLYSRYLEQFSYEVEAYARVNFAQDIRYSDYLVFCGVPTERSIDIRFSDRTEMLSWAEVTPQAPEPFVSYHVTNKVGVFTLRQCINNAEYRRHLANFFTELSAKAVDVMILDLRGNSGGDNAVATEFFRYLPIDRYLAGTSHVRYGPFLLKFPIQAQRNRQLSPTFSGEIFVEVDAHTFSSAVDFAARIHDNRLGQLIGEAPGGLPASYGDVIRFQAPNSGVVVQVSHKFFTRPDPSLGDAPLLPGSTELPGRFR